MKHIFKLSLLSTLVLATSAQAEEGFRQHEAHIHGHVEFNMAQEGSELLVEITAPGSDIVGFEHAPADEQQHQLIEQAEQTLKQAESILLISQDANCRVEHINVTNTLESEEQHGEHDEHDEHDEHEGDEHNHDDSHEGSEHEESGHGQFTVEYHFECSEISKLHQVKTTWFEHFPKTDKISVNLLTDTSQKALELNSNHTLIQF
ncbi:DUF2796 domain-containing protein [Vibrio sp. DW001]|uniref:zinc uptake protein ZrgA n=1 Tax=Vibrio sp. DW001 TaxID=2912315 RepID=UPI0023B096B1|nr:DUF2796 domain-containing protein [Vibrio sp. DW001]WED26986.1 DUF2796 domain-containing protein [Vibrio sp. DW001]